MLVPLDQRLRFWGELAELMFIAAQAGAERAQQALRKRRKGYRTRRPGLQTPMWNVCAALLRQNLRPYGSKVRLARYLGIPKQRLNDYLKARSRLPDAEVLLRMLHWLSEKNAKKSRDLTL